MPLVDGHPELFLFFDFHRHNNIRIRHKISIFQKNVQIRIKRIMLISWKGRKHKGGALCALK
jgi:hypothetical protein